MVNRMRCHFNKGRRTFKCAGKMFFRSALSEQMSLEAGARGSSQVPSFFFLHFFLFYFLTKPLESVKAECALSIEERRRKPGICSPGRFWLHARGVAEFPGMGPTPPKNLKLWFRWELSG